MHDEAAADAPVAKIEKSVEYTYLSNAHVLN
jgi:hypothetical protein